MQQVYEAIQKRRSIRKYKEQPLPKHQLDLLVQAAQVAPSGRNTHSRQITVLRDKALMAQLAEAICHQLSHLVAGEYRFFGADTLILLSDVGANTLGEADCACALENIFIMAAAMNVGSCWVNQLKGICHVPEIRALLDRLGIPADHVVWGVAALGVPDEAPKARTKQSKVHFVE